MIPNDIKFIVGDYTDCVKLYSREYTLKNPRTFTPYYETRLSTAHPLNFKEIINTFKFTLILLWTNNPYHLDGVNPHEIAVVYKNKWKRLDEHPDYERWKEEMDGGELWSLFAEDWIDNV